MVNSFLALLLLLLVAPVGAIDPIPAGTEFGRVYVRVTDCLSGSAIVGASVNLDNPTHRASSVTNSTGYAVVEVFAWFYQYYITASGYRIDAGTRRFALNEIFQVCLVPEAAGFWRVVASVLAWQGDIHAGGRGWAVIRLKNLEPGIFNITEFQIWVAGYDGPATTHYTPRGVILDRLVDKDINITISPKPDVPTGRLKAELRFKAVFTGADGRKIGPLTVSTNLDYIVISPFRTFKVRIMDYWGLNPVPDATVEMMSTLPGATATFRYKSDENGYIELLRMNDDVYLTRIYYVSPYDGEVHLVGQFFPILAELAKNPVVKTFLYEVHADVRDLENRPLEADVYINDVKAVAVGGIAKFVNVPAGSYKVKVDWMSVQVFTSELKVSEPLVLYSPGGYLQARAEVADIDIRIQTREKKNVEIPLKVKLSPLDRIVENTSNPYFEKLPKGTYRLEISAYNFFKGRYVTVGETTFKIPDDRGEKTILVDVFDAEIEVTDYGGRSLSEAEVRVDGKPVLFRDGRIILKSITKGEYNIEIFWKGFRVFDASAKLEPSIKLSLSAAIYTMKVKVVGIDGYEIQRATAFLFVGDRVVESKVVNGTVSFDEVPSGSHQLEIILDDVKIFSETIRAGLEVEVVANAGYVELVFKDQRQAPVAGVVVDVPGVGSDVTKTDGTVRLGQKPVASYKYAAKFRGFNVLEGVAKVGERTEVMLPLYNFKVVVVNELDRPITASFELSRDDVPLGRSFGSEAEYVNFPPGAYLLRTTVGTKTNEKQVVVVSDGQTFTIKMPVLFVLGNIALSTQELTIIILPIGATIIVVVSAIVISKGVSRRSGRLKGRL
ncbi:MAG: hypothetical protein RMI49_01710 [Candidatus Caldarchaeum sp.]|nr:hypothetical protein [Candidatus Caldarchaeum sp.]